MTKDKDVGEMLSQFSTDTSLHGVKHICDGSKGVRRFFWAAALLAMLSFLVWVILIQVTNVLSYPFYTVTILRQSHEMPFPSVTICNNNQFRMSYIANNSMAQMYIRAMYDNGPNKPVVNFSDPIYVHRPDSYQGAMEMYAAAAHQLNTMFRFCSWMSVMINCSEFLTPRLTSYGYCYTFNSLEYISNHGSLNATYPGETGGLNVIFDIEEHEYFYGPGSSTGIKVLVHDHDEIPNMRSHGFFVGPGTKVAAGTSVTKISCLPLPYTAMGDEDCWDTNDPNFKTPLTFYNIYDIRACYLECASKMAIRACGCQDTYDNAVNVSICSLHELVECYIPVKAKNRKLPVLQQECNCKRQCQWNQYDVSISSAGFPTSYDVEQYVEERNITREYVRMNYLELSVFYKQMVYTEIKQEPAYTTVDIVANLGGQLGIFLGASFLTLTEVAEYLIGIVLVCFKRKKTAVTAWSEGNGKVSH